MSMYRLFQGVIGRLKRRRWGVRIERPNEPPLDSGVEEFAQEVYQALGSDAPIVLSGPIRITRTFSGPAFEITGTEAGIGYVAADGTTSGSTPATMRVRLVSIGDDTLRVQSSTNGDTFDVLKPYELRRSSFDRKTINSITYTYTGPQTRDASGTIETVQPPYAIGDELVLVSIQNGYAVSGPDGDPLLFTDSNVGAKVWAAENSPANPDGNSRWRIMPTTSYTQVIPRYTISDVSFTKAIYTSLLPSPGTTNTTPVVVTTTTPHGLSTHQRIVISGCNVAALNTTWVITRLTDTTFRLNDSTAPGSEGTSGTITHDLVVTLDVSGLTRPQHRLNTGIHVTIEDVEGATQANGTWTIDSGYFDIDNKTEASGEIKITTFVPHGYSTGEMIRVEALEKGIHDESEGTWEITVLTPTTFTLNGSVYETAYEGRGGLCARATTFRIVEPAWTNRVEYAVGDTVLYQVVRYVCILAHVNKVPPNATYWSVVTWSAYTSGGTVIIPGQIEIDSASTPPLTPTSSADEVQAARAAAEAAGWVLGAPLRLRTAGRTVYGVIVGIPGSEGFPYTDPAPLPTILDNTLLYAGPPLLENLTELAIGDTEMVVQKQLTCNVLPHFGALSTGPMILLTNRGTYKAGTGGTVVGRYGKTFTRWDGPSARCVAMSSQQDFAADSASIGDFSGGTVNILPDARRPAYFSGGVPLESETWSGTRQYVVGEVVKDGALYVCVATHNLTGTSNPRQPTVGTNTPDYWRHLNSTTLEWSSTMTYVRDDIVVDGEQLYICTVGHAVSHQPSVGTNVPDYWSTTSLAITPSLWNATVSYSVGNIVAQGGVLYRCLVAHDNTPDIGAEPGIGANTDTYWELATRSQLRDGSVQGGSKVTRADTISFSAGRVDTGVIGWRFTNAGRTTFVKDSVLMDPREIVSITNATPQVVTTALDHELRTGAWVTISGSGVADGDWVITRTSNTAFYLRGSAASGVGNAGRVSGRTLRQFIVEEFDLTEASGASYTNTDIASSPRINLDIGGQMVSTNDDHRGFRTALYDSMAQWNPANEIHVNGYDVIYNSRIEVACTSVGNPPGLPDAEPDEYPTYIEGTIEIDHGVVILTGGTFPDWALFGELTIEGDTAVLAVDAADAWSSSVTYLPNQLVLDAVASVMHVFRSKTTNTNIEPSTSAPNWEDLGPVTNDGTSSGYDTHLQLANRFFSCLPGTPYVLRQVGHPPQYLTVFLTFVIL